MVKHVLLLEDDADTASVLRSEAEKLGLQVTVIADGERGLSEALSGKYSLAILDIMLPNMNGLDICREIRRQNPRLPVLMLTARGEELDRVLGLELGADDYVSKPFSVPEVVARIRALLRRTQVDTPQEQSAVHPSSVHRSGELEVDLEMRRITLHGKPLELTALELLLLELLLSRPGKVFAREEIIESLWGSYFRNIEPSLTRIVSRLRAKIEADSSQPKFVLTVTGIGYKWGG